MSVRVRITAANTRFAQRGFEKGALKRRGIDARYALVSMHLVTSDSALAVHDGTFRLRASCRLSDYRSLDLL